MKSTRFPLKQSVIFLSVSLVISLSVFGQTSLMQSQDAAPQIELPSSPLPDFLKAPQVTSGHGCSVSGGGLSRFAVNTNFRLKIVSGGAPRRGVSVAMNRLRPTGKPNYYSGFEKAANTSTDASGVVKFEDLQPGTYILVISDSLAPYSSYVFVSDAQENQDVSLEWPTTRFAVRHLDGELIAVPEKQPKADALVEVFEVRTSRLIATTRTDSEGHYQFRYLADGTYVLRFTSEDEFRNHQDTAIVVSKRNKLDKVPTMQIQSSFCGLSVIPIT